MQKYNRHLINQTGTAVFMALLILVLVTTMSVAWFMQSSVIIRSTEQMLTSEKMNLLSQSVVDWAISTVVISSQNENTIWPKIFSEYKMADSQAIISGSVDDYQSRININRLTNKETQNAFMKLLSILRVNISEKNALALRDEIIAWITPVDSITPAMIAINSQYNKKNPSYRAANRPLQSVSELRLIQGVTPSLYLSIRPYLCALPPKISPNLIFASPVVRQAFDVKAASLATFKPSEYFIVRSDVRLSNQYLVLYTLLHKTMLNNKAQVGIVWQSRGTL